MSTPILKTLALLVLAAFCSLALADDPPGRVGRISSTQGHVTISANEGEQASGALLNWPVTSDNEITTAHGARAEFRVGSTAVRLDGDSALEVMELDDDRLKLRLHYGSVSVRIRNPDMLRGFELNTAQGRVLMQEPGRLRVDAERERDTSVVSVFAGVARVDGGGASLTLRAGKRAEIVDNDVRTGRADSDDFDHWAQARDASDDRSASPRYVSREITGYEELDRYGSWRQDAEYGPLWLPRAVPFGWAPYRDGRWAWVAPWGWTWVDHAAWGYAPSHYGRWVLVDRRWCWAPGRIAPRPVWAPALVGWVGGNNWQATFNARGVRHSAPAVGWYPLSPRDAYVPTYRSSQEHMRHLNADHGNWQGRGARDYGRNRPGRYDGITVVPHDQFSTRNTVVVPQAPKAIIVPTMLQNAPAATSAPARMVEPGREHRANRGERIDRGERSGRGERDDRGERWQQRGSVQPALPAPAPIAGQPPPAATQPTAPIQTGTPNNGGRTGLLDSGRARRGQQQPAPALPAAVAPMREDRFDADRHDRRNRPMPRVAVPPLQIVVPAQPAPLVSAPPAANPVQTRREPVELEVAPGQREPGSGRFGPSRPDRHNRPTPQLVTPQPQAAPPPQPVPVRAVTQPQPMAAPVHVVQPPQPVAPPAPPRQALPVAAPPPAAHDAARQQGAERRDAAQQQREQRREANQERREQRRDRRNGQDEPADRR